MLLQVGKPDEAIAELKAAVKLKPDDSEAIYNLAVHLKAAGRLQQAIDEYYEAVRLAPDFFEARNNLGVALIDDGQPREAIKQLQRSHRPGIR